MVKKLLFAQGEGNRPMFVNDIARWISSIPDIESRLRSQGGHVLDVGGVVMVGQVYHWLSHFL
jgi:hypothetical protein